MKTRIMKKIFAGLLTAAMLAACVPTVAFAEKTVDINDHLMIHYDFKGDTWAERLADKAGDTEEEKTNLYMLQPENGVATVDESGKVTNANNPNGASESLLEYFDNAYTVTDDVISTKKTTANRCLVTNITEEIKRIHNPSKPTDLTVYIRAQVDTWAEWNVLFDMRNTTTSDEYPNGNRVLYIEARKGTNDASDLYEKAELRIDTAGYLTELGQENIYKTDSEGNPTTTVSKYGVDNDGDNWVDLAVVRTAAPTADSSDVFTFYALVNGSWVRVYQAVSGNAHNTSDSSSLVLSLFGGANGGVDTKGNRVPSGNKTQFKYDDIRIYDMALNEDQLTEMLEDKTDATLPDNAEVSTGVVTDLSENLLIHYDFEGATLTDQLKDKAGTTKTHLGAYFAAQANASASSAAASKYFHVTDGVITANTDYNGQLVLATTSTADTQAMYGGNAMTVYMRMKVDAWKTWSIPLSMRAGGAGNSAFHLEINENGFQTNPGGNYKYHNIPKNEIDPDEDGWVEFAAARTADGVYTYYAKTAAGWTSVNAPENTGAVTVAGEMTPAMVLSLFGGYYNSNVVGNSQTNYHIDDVRIYSIALNASQLASVSADVVTRKNVNMLGVQRSTSTFDNGTTYKLRLVAAIKGDTWEKAGFKVSLTSEKTVYLPVTKAYKSLLAEDDGGMNSVITAPDGTYLIAVTLDGIPVEYDDMNISVTPYAIKGSNTSNGKEVVVAVKNGGISSIDWASDTIAGTNPTLVDFYMNYTMTEDVRADQALCEALVVRMGGSAVLKLGSSSVLWNGYIRKLDVNDYSKTAARSGTAINVPADFANRFFGVDTYTGTVDIKALAESKGYTVLVEGDLVILTDPVVADFADGGTDGAYTNAQYKARMLEFFTYQDMNGFDLEPNNNTEQNRVVIEDAVNYYPEESTDFEQPFYINYYSPAVLSASDGTLYAANERCVTQNGAEPSTVTVIHKSTDNGLSWEIIDTIGRFYWASFFEVTASNRGSSGNAGNDGIYLIGNVNRKVMIYKMGANGKFTVAAEHLTENIGDAYSTGHLYNNWNAAICNPAIIDNILYLPLDYTVASCELSKDITNKANWKFTCDPSDLITVDWLNDNLGYTLSGAGSDGSIMEGNIVKGTDNNIYVYWRLESGPEGDRTIKMLLGSDRDTLTWPGTDKTSVICDTLPTTVSRFGIKYDSTLGMYICLSNWWTVDDQYRARNVVGLSVSTDLVNWTKVDTILVDRAMVNEHYSCLAHAFQYFAWDFDGEDIVLTVREAQGFTNTFHDGKYFTFYRLTNYADLINSIYNSTAES